MHFLHLIVLLFKLDRRRQEANKGTLILDEENAYMDFDETVSVLATIQSNCEHSRRNLALLRMANVCVTAQCNPFSSHEPPATNHCSLHFGLELMCRRVLARVETSFA